jgi:hypothetical protein
MDNSKTETNQGIDGAVGKSGQDILNKLA